MISSSSVQSFVFSLSLSSIMFPSILLTFLFVLITNFTLIYSKSIVIEVKGDCATVGQRVAHEHGYRYVRQVRFHLKKSSLRNMEISFDRRFLMDFVKLKKIHHPKNILDIDELSREESIQHESF